MLNRNLSENRFSRSPQRHRPRDSLENHERPLPKGWNRRTSNNVYPGKVYYTNGRQSKWHFPNQDLNRGAEAEQTNSHAYAPKEIEEIPSTLSTRQMNGKQLVEFLLKYHEEIKPSDIKILRMVADPIEWKHNSHLRPELYGVHHFVKKDGTILNTEEVEDRKHSPLFKKALTRGSSDDFSPTSLGYYEDDKFRPKLFSFSEMKDRYKQFSVQTSAGQGKIFTGYEDPNDWANGGKYDSLRDEGGKLVTWEYW